MVLGYVNYLLVWAALAPTGVVVLVMGRFEEPRPDTRPAPPVWMPIATAVLVIASLAVMASVGTVGQSGVAWLRLLLPTVGMLVFRVAGVRCRIEAA